MSRKVTKTKLRYIRNLINQAAADTIAENERDLRLARYAHQQGTGVSIKEALARIKRSK